MISLAVIVVGLLLVFTLNENSTGAYFGLVGVVIAAGLVLWLGFGV